MRALVMGSLLLVLGGADSAAADSQPVAVVTSLSGNATLVRTATAGPTVVAPRTRVRPGDRITTAPDSVMRLLLGHAAVATVAGRTEIEISATPSGLRVDLRSGALALAVAPERMLDAGTVELTTPGSRLEITRGVVVAEISDTAQAAGVTARFVSLSASARLSTETDPGAATLEPLSSVAVVHGRPSAPVTVTRAEAERATASLKVPLARAPGMVPLDRERNPGLLRGDDLVSRQGTLRSLATPPSTVVGGSFGSSGGSVGGITPFQRR